MKNIYVMLQITSLTFTILIFGCGGVGGGGSSTTTPIGTPVNLGVIKSFQEASGAVGTTITFNLSGTASNGVASVNLTATATKTISSPTTTIISSQTTTLNVVQSTLTVTETSLSPPQTQSGTCTNYILPTGFLYNEVCPSSHGTGTPTSQTLLPATAKVGDSGNDIALNWSDGTIETDTWRIDPGNNGDAIFVAISSVTNSSNVLQVTESDAYIIKPDGTVSALSITVTYVSTGITIKVSGNKI